MSARLAALRYCFAMVLVYVVIASASRRGVYADESSLTPCHCTVGAGCINNTCYIDDSEPREQCLVSFLYEPPRYACLKESILHATRCVEISPGQLTRCCRRVAFCNVDFSGPVPTGKDCRIWHCSSYIGTCLPRKGRQMLYTREHTSACTHRHAHT